MLLKQPSTANPNGLLLDAAAVTEFAMRAGYKKTHMTLPKTILLAVMAGVFISFGGQTLFSVLVGVDDSGPVKLLGGSFFSLALTIIVICGAELFTGNVLIFIAVLARRVYVWEYLYDLVVVYFSNFLGTIVFALVFWGSGVNGFDGDLTATGKVACKVAVAKANLSEYQAFFRGIGANMCVCFAVLMSYASPAPGDKILSIVFPIAAFVVMGFEHSVANMYFFSMGTLLNCEGMLQRKTWAELFLCTAGNLLGAMFLAVVYWYINIHGTKLELQHVPHEPAEDVLRHSTINPASFCGAETLLAATTTTTTVKAQPIGFEAESGRNDETTRDESEVVENSALGHLHTLVRRQAACEGPADDDATPKAVHFALSSSNDRK